MDVSITPHDLFGTVEAISSKSCAHRALICASFANGATNITCPYISEDIQATVDCLKALGTTIARTKQGFRVVPAKEQNRHQNVQLNCKESGTTLRFLLPLLGALNVNATISAEGRLFSRPLEPLVSELSAHGMSFSWQDEKTLEVSGKLIGGLFELPGDISSQFISGLLLSLPLLNESSTIQITGSIQSKDYLAITEHALKDFGVTTVFDAKNATYTIEPQHYVCPGVYSIEGDWSNAAPWLAAGAIGQGVAVTGLSMQSVQGDRAILAALSLVGARVSRQQKGAACMMDHLRPFTISVSEVCDLAPVLAALAAFIPGTSRLTNIQRLRLKESDRVQSICSVLRAFGVTVELSEDQTTLEIMGGKQPTSCIVDSCKDHRIVMMATILASYATGPVVITHAEAINKSYPLFFEHFKQLGGVCHSMES